MDGVLSERGSPDFIFLRLRFFNPNTTPPYVYQFIGDGSSSLVGEDGLEPPTSGE